MMSLSKEGEMERERKGCGWERRSISRKGKGVLRLLQDKQR